MAIEGWPIKVKIRDCEDFLQKNWDLRIWIKTLIDEDSYKRGDQQNTKRQLIVQRNNLLRRNDELTLAFWE